MTHSTPDAVLLVMPRDAWDVLAGTRAPDVREALGSLVQVDTCLHGAVMVVNDHVERMRASVHLDAAESCADTCLSDPDLPVDATFMVMSVPVGLDRPGEATP